MKEAVECSSKGGINSRNYYTRLKVPFWKANMGQKSLSHIGSSVWNKSPVSMKRSTSLNPFKHDVKNINYKNYGCNIIIFIIIITNTDTNFIIFIVTIIIIITILMLLSHYYCYRYCHYHYYHCLCNYIFFP